MTCSERIDAECATDVDLAHYMSHRHRGIVRILARRFGQPLADELASEAVVRAVKRVRAGKLRVPFDAWILMVAVNYGRDLTRRRARFHRFRSYLASPSVHCGTHDDHLDATVASRVDLNSALLTLSEGSRQIVALRFCDDLSVSGVAERVGRSEQSVRSLLYRSKALLRDRADLREPQS